MSAIEILYMKILLSTMLLTESMICTTGCEGTTRSKDEIGLCTLHTQVSHFIKIIRLAHES